MGISIWHRLAVTANAPGAASCRAPVVAKGRFILGSGRRSAPEEGHLGGGHHRVQTGKHVHKASHGLNTDQTRSRQQPSINTKHTKHTKGIVMISPRRTRRARRANLSGVFALLASFAVKNESNPIQNWSPNVRVSTATCSFRSPDHGSGEFIAPQGHVVPGRSRAEFNRCLPFLELLGEARRALVKVRVPGSCREIESRLFLF